MKKIYFGFLFFTFILSEAQVSTFSFNINGTVPSGFAEALNIAGQRWSNHLNITIPIKVNVFTVNAAILPFSAITLANGKKNFANAPFTNILYTTALANQLAEVETNTGEYDMDIYFNLATPYYFGTAKPPFSQIDFISTAMHEIGHGLGFYSDGYVDASGNGSFGNIPPTALFPLTPSFPWRGQDSVPSIYDTYIIKSSGNHLTTCAAANSTALGDSIKNGGLYFNGPTFSNASHANTPVRLAGGAGTYSLGVDLLHIHNSYANTIMSYYWGAGDTVRTPAKWELGILKEIGWNSRTVNIKEYSPQSSVIYYPNPANTRITVSSNFLKTIELYTLQGEKLQTSIINFTEDELMMDTEGLNEGVYFLKIIFNKNNTTTAMKKIIVKH